jgi:hypothetical protein
MHAVAVGPGFHKPTEEAFIFNQVVVLSAFCDLTTLVKYNYHISVHRRLSVMRDTDCGHSLGRAKSLDRLLSQGFLV